VSETAIRRVISDAADLLQIAELTGVTTYEVRGRRIEDGEDGGDEPTQDLEVMARGSDDLVETRLRFTYTTTVAELYADIGVHYAIREPVEIPEVALREFVERVGVMGVFPFVRESLFTTATRLGVDAPVLGLLRAGQFKIAPEEAQDG
jgi:hypothetical protein